MDIVASWLSFHPHLSFIHFVPPTTKQKIIHFVLLLIMILMMMMILKMRMPLLSWLLWLLFVAAVTEQMNPIYHTIWYRRDRRGRLPRRWRHGRHEEEDGKGQRSYELLLLENFFKIFYIHDVFDDEVSIVLCTSIQSFVDVIIVDGGCRGRQEKREVHLYGTTTQKKETDGAGRQTTAQFSKVCTRTCLHSFPSLLMTTLCSFCYRLRCYCYRYRYPLLTVDGHDVDRENCAWRLQLNWIERCSLAPPLHHHYLDHETMKPRISEHTDSYIAVTSHNFHLSSDENEMRWDEMILYVAWCDVMWFDVKWCDMPCERKGVVGCGCFDSPHSTWLGSSWHHST